MRHRKKFNHLGRKSAHRQQTLSSMATALILHKRINTTLAKAKALRVYVEPLITKSKVDSTHSRRTVFSYLGDKNAVSELFRDVAQKVADRPGGYTRILKTGFRKGDSAEMCFIELVDYNANMLSTEEETKQKTTRRGGRRKKTTEAAVPAKATENVEQTPAEQDAAVDKASAAVEVPSVDEASTPEEVTSADEASAAEAVTSADEASTPEAVTSAKEVTATEESKPESEDQAKDSEDEKEK